MLAVAKMSDLKNYKMIVSLDETEQNKMVVRIRADEDFSIIESFAIIQLHWKDSHPIEIVKIDGNKKESIHMHNFFIGPGEKEYHNRPVSYEAVIYYYEKVMGNWRWYLAQYQNNYI
ncbi:MAG: hypothetical protein Q8P05_06150 [Candidatus Diapherotrites archaeon]|nr:hypothetical protein [Candidatus Diapherotrites archaeon]